MTTRVVLALLILAAKSGISGASRVMAGAGSLSLVEEIDKDMLLKIPKIINSAGTLGISLMTAFNEEDPDVEYALENLEIQGWQLIKLSLPDEEAKSPNMIKAKKAWDTAFADMPEIADEIMQAWSNKDSHAGIRVMMRTMDTGLRASAEAMTAQAKTFHAANECIQSLGASTIKFMEAMGIGVQGSSLMQVGAGREKWDAAKLNNLLTTGVGLVTTFLAAATEEPPDFRYAIDSFRVQGWKVVKMVVDPEEVRSPWMKKAKKAWTEVFKDAPELAESAYSAYMEGDTMQTVEVVVGTMDKGLRTAAHINEGKAQLFNAVADLVMEVSHTIVKFAQEVGWMSR